MNDSLKKYFHGDGVIWGVIIALSLISLLAVYSATGTLAYKYQHGNTNYYILKHLTYMFIGLMITFVTHHIPYQLYSRLSQLLLFLCIPLLGITLAFGTNLNQAQRWLTLPGLGLTIQTSDFAKLALIMYLARLLSLKQEDIKDFKKAFIPLLAPVALVCILIFPANFSTAAILFFTSLVLMFIGRVKMKQILALVGIGVVLGGMFIGISLLTKHEGRIKVWQNRIEHFVSGESEDNFQAEQAKIAIATGGIIGKGPGNSTQRNFLPHPYSDFIYAIIVEEYGLAGGLTIMFLYLWLLFRAGIIVRKSDRTFPAFLAIGLTVILVFQAMINMAVAVNLFPVTGQTLPLVSMGGSSQLFTCFALGIILSVSRPAKKAKRA
ncbi:MAG: FtsW/RodA/SpoVE family cell cycle protein [Bacteroidales bacterium]|nr:FtsW/RodA/SpoVE family cell cycle protein [Bacteroidales bacterium]